MVICYSIIILGMPIKILETLDCFILTLNVESVLLDTLWQQMPSMVIAIVSLDIRSQYMCLTSILYFYCIIS